MSNLNETLRPQDLKNLISNIFEVDSYNSKMGTDKDIVVVSFTVENKEPADDLINFIERGYEFVLDADASPSEAKDGRYKVFVEIERTRHIPEQIMEVLYGLEKLTGIDDFKFRYYKSFKSILANKETLEDIVPVSKQDYDVAIKENSLNNFSNFFNKSYLDSINLNEDDILFQKMYSDSLRMRIINAGNVHDVYESLQGRIMLEQKDMGEILYLTKYLGNYNITKVGDVFVFENQKFAVALRRI
jgi:hypothetical protein